MKEQKNTFQKFFSLLIVVAVVMGMHAQAETYPDMPVSGPTNVDLSWMAEFKPPVNNKTPVAGTPQISEWTHQNQPGDTMALTGEALSSFTGTEEGRDSRFVIYGEGWPETDGLIQRLDGRQCAITLSTNLPPNEMYLMWPRNDHGFGKPVAINQTEAWWVGFDKVTRGETFYVYGRNLELGGGDCHLFIKELDRWLTSSDANPYKATFKMPENVPNGTYTIYAHNGHGRKNGWSDSLGLTVESAYSWNTNVYNVVDYGADGSDTNEDSAAIDAAIAAAASDPGSTVYFPIGTYFLTRPLYIKKNIKYTGAGIDSTFLTPHSSKTNAFLMVGGWSGATNFELREMTILTGHNPSTTPIGIGNKADFFVENVRFSDTNAPTELAQSPADFSGCIRVKFKGCEFIGKKGVNFGKVTQARIEDCIFNGRADMTLMVSIAESKRLDINHCIARNYDMSDASNGSGWAKGRWLVTEGAATDLYIGDNETIDCGPRHPSPFLSDLIPINVGPWEDNGHEGTKILYFEDIPNEYHGRGDGERSYRGTDVYIRYLSDNNYREKEWHVVTLDAINNTITIEVPEWADPWFGNDDSLICDVMDKVDANSGEQILFEGVVCRFSGKPLTITPNKMTFADKGFLNHADVYKANIACIVEGRGLGQSYNIESIDASTGEVILSQPWRVFPGTNSVVRLGAYVDNVSIYNNIFDGRPDNTASYTATTAINVYGGSSDIVLSGNVFSELREGVTFFSEGNSDYYKENSAMPQSFFNHVENNRFINCYNDIYMRCRLVGRTKPALDSGAMMLGNVFRRNYSTGALNNLAYLGVETDPAVSPIKMNIFQDNIFSNFINTIQEQEGIENQVWIGNTFAGDGDGVGYTISDGHTPVLRGNAWINFDEPYGGSLPGAILELPIRHVELSNKSLRRGIPVLNSGTEQFTFTVVKETESPWLRVSSPTSTVAAESNKEQIELEIVSAPAENSKAIIAVTGGGQTKQITVYFSALESADGTGTIVVDLSVYEPGSRVRATVEDLGTPEAPRSGEVRDLGELDITKDLVLKDLENHAYRFVFEVYNDASATWATNKIYTHHRQR